MHPNRIEEEETSQDSFLDVIANVVGVLIILVMLVGAQASRGLLVSSKDARRLDSAKLASENVPDIDKLQKDLEDATRQALAEQQLIVNLATHVTRISHEAQATDRQRVELAMHRAVMEEDLERRRDLLDTQRQQEFDVQRQLMQSQIQLEQLTQEQLSQLSAPEEVEELECVPTPLAKVVEGPSLHLRLRQGLVSIVPLEELMAQIQMHAEEIRRRLQTNSQLVETFGPIDGYRVKFTLIRRRSANSVAGPRVGQREENTLEQYAEFLPASEDIGLPVEQALMPGSALQELLQAVQQQSPSVVVWLYTDSFDEFRTLKRALWEMGFPLAVRPLPPGASIGASPHGSKSAAQ